MMDYLGYEINFGTIEKPNNIRVYHTPEQVDQGTMDGTTDIQTALGFHGTPDGIHRPLTWPSETNSTPCYCISSSLKYIYKRNYAHLTI